MALLYISWHSINPTGVLIVLLCDQDFILIAEGTRIAIQFVVSIPHFPDPLIH